MDYWKMWLDSNSEVYKPRLVEPTRGVIRLNKSQISIVSSTCIISTLDVSSSRVTLVWLSYTKNISLALCMYEKHK